MSETRERPHRSDAPDDRDPAAREGWLASEDGAAYTLSYVMTFPIYMLLVCLVIQATLMLVVKMGTIYAAFASARAAVVWGPAVPSLGQEKARLAAIQAMAPFASSSDLHAAGAGASGATAESRRFFEAYRRTAQPRATADYITSKYRYAARATEVFLDESGDRDVTARVAYEMPLVIPGAGRVLGHKAPWAGARFHTRRIETSVTLTSEKPNGPDGTLGIDYVSE